MRVRKRKKFWLPFMALSLLLFGFSLFKVFGILNDSREQQNKFDEIAAEFGNSVSFDTESEAVTGSASSSVQTASRSDNVWCLQRLRDKNSDLGGWIRIEGTKINYPVMFTPDKPQKYLHLAFDGTDSSYGVPFFGDGCSLSSRSDNLIIFGHHMNDGSMFAALMDYAGKDFWEKHQTVGLCTPYETGKYRIFAAFPVDLNNEEQLHFYDFIDAADDKDFNNFIRKVQAASLYDTGVKASYGDKLLMLSTCDNQKKSGRFLVAAVKSSGIKPESVK